MWMVEHTREGQARHGLSTADFLQRAEENVLEETLACAEWIGECRLQERLLEKADAVRAIRFAD
jgi:hypothetical protein